MKYLGLVSFSFSFCASELVEAEGKVFGLKKRKKKKKKGFQPHSFLQVGFTTVVDGGFVLQKEHKRVSCDRRERDTQHVLQ